MAEVSFVTHCPPRLWAGRRGWDRALSTSFGPPASTVPASGAAGSQSFRGSTRLLHDGH